MIPTAFIILCILGALGFGLAAAWSDIKGLKIPNLYCLAILLLFGFAFATDFFAGGGVFHNLKGHLISAAVMFALTTLLYALKLLGAGDSKLASAFALWTGLSALPVFLFYMTCFGGILGLIAYTLQKLKPFKSAPNESWIGKLQNGANAIPYGTAITFGAVAGFIKAGYFSVFIM